MLSTELSGLRASTVNDVRLNPTYPVAGTPTNTNCEAAGKTVNKLLVPAVKVSPLVLVAVSVTVFTALAVGRITPVIVMVLVPAKIVPVIVPPITPAAPFVLKLNAVFAATFEKSL